MSVPMTPTGLDGERNMDRGLSDAQVVESAARPLLRSGRERLITRRRCQHADGVGYKCRRPWPLSVRRSARSDHARSVEEEFGGVVVADGGHGSVEHVDYERPRSVVDEFNLSCLDRIAQAEHGGRSVVVQQHVTVVRHTGGLELVKVGIDKRGLMG